MKKYSSIQQLAFGGLMMALVFIATALLPRIPIPFAQQSYIHAGDSMIFVAAILLGWKSGAIAGGIGSALADLFVGATIWAFPTLIIKALMGAIVGIKAQDKPLISWQMLISVTLGGLIMIVGYYIAEAFIVANWIVPIFSVPFNIIQFVGGSIIAFLVLVPLKKSRYFRLGKN